MGAWKVQSVVLPMGRVVESFCISMNLLWPQKWIILYSVLLLMKPKARSGQIRFVHMIASQECDRRWKNTCSKEISILDVLNNKFDGAVKFSLTKKWLYAYFKYEQSNLLLFFYVTSNSKWQVDSLNLIIIAYTKSSKQHTSTSGRKFFLHIPF